MWPFSSRGSQHGQTQQTPSAVENTAQSYSSEVLLQQEPSSILSSDHDQDQNNETVLIFGQPGQRLGVHPILRAPMLGLTAFICGFSLGAAQGGPIAAYRYRAENAHRLPTTRTGWFLYQKTKNYHTIVGSVKEGVRYGGILTAWAALFMLAEEGIDRVRGRLLAKDDQDYAPGQRDFFNTVLAAVGMAGFYSWKNQLDQYATAKNTKLALRVALPFGLVQDVAASVRGSEPAYIKWLKNKFWKGRDQHDEG